MSKLSYGGIPDVKGNCFNCANYCNDSCPQPKYVECMFYRNDNFTEDEWREYELLIHV